MLTFSTLLANVPEVAEHAAATCAESAPEHATFNSVIFLTFLSFIVLSFIVDFLYNDVFLEKHKPRGQASHLYFMMSGFTIIEFVRMIPELLVHFNIVH